MSRVKSEAFYDRAVKVIPGGVNSPVRAFKAVGGAPVFMARGDGAYLFDVDGNRYLDCIGSWGPLILGHIHPRVKNAISRQLSLGTTFGAPTELEILLAEKIILNVPSIEMVRMVSSGTEATMSAIRVARGFTGRTKIVKFEGNYHGHFDALLAKAGSGIATLGLPDSAGVPASITQDTLTIPYNNIAAVKELFDKVGSEVACIIVEPVVGNSGCIAPQPGFLEALREVATASGAVLIFDEVMTGFRLSIGGAQDLYGVSPDMTALGKIVGGGLPLAAYGGKREIMECVAPVGPVYQAGTLSGNPMAVAAGLETLTILEEDPTIYSQLNQRGEFVAKALKSAAKSAGQVVTVNQVGSMVTVFFTSETVTDYTTAKTSDTAKYAQFFHDMLNNEVYLPPAQFEAAFMTAAMSDEDMVNFEAAAVASMAAIQ